MNKNYKLLIGIGALAALYFVFKKKGTTAKSTSADKSPEAQKIMNPFASFEGISDDDFYKMDEKRKELGALYGRSSENFKRLEDFANANNIDISKYITAVKKVSNKGQSRIKPTSVSGISMVQRPRNYGTAQRPTRALTPISITPSFAGFMDFDGNDGVMADML